MKLMQKCMKCLGKFSGCGGGGRGGVGMLKVVMGGVETFRNVQNLQFS